MVAFLYTPQVEQSVPGGGVEGTYSALHVVGVVYNSQQFGHHPPPFPPRSEKKRPSLSYLTCRAGSCFTDTTGSSLYSSSAPSVLHPTTAELSEICRRQYAIVQYGTVCPTYEG